MNLTHAPETRRIHRLQLFYLMITLFLKRGEVAGSNEEEVAEFYLCTVGMSVLFRNPARSFEERGQILPLRRCTS
jgi:hypothetical protein